MNKLEEELNNMEDGLRRLKIEYHIFFNGNRKKPPDDMKLRLERLAKQLSERSDMTHAQRFRYNTLLTRYYTHKDLWRRIQREREQGKKTEPKAPAPVPPVDKKPPIEKFRISVSDPKTEEDKVKSLYETLLKYKTDDSGSPALSYPQFARYIASQTRDIREKYRCSCVAYRILLEGGVVRFTAAAEKISPNFS